MGLTFFLAITLKVNYPHFTVMIEKKLVSFVSETRKIRNCSCEKKGFDISFMNVLDFVFSSLSFSRGHTTVHEVGEQMLKFAKDARVDIKSISHAFPN